VKVDLLLLDVEADMNAEEQAALEASISRGLAEGDRGELHSIGEVGNRQYGRLRLRRLGP
jgi:predicted transcriptional regulator